MTEREFRLRQRIDVLQDRVDRLERQLEKSRKRSDKYRLRCYDLERGRAMWRNRATRRWGQKVAA